MCPPERPRSGVSIRKGHIPHPQKRRFHALKCLCIAHDAHLLTMDAPLQGDTGGHTGTAPTSLHQTPLPRNLPRFCPSAEPLPAIISHVCPSANCSPATLGHGVTRGMVGAVPVCPPERPRNGVSIRKEHVHSHKGGVSIHRNVCALRMMHTRYRWMRPCRATRAGTQAPPLPTSIKPLFRQSFLMFAHRQSLFRHPWDTEPHEKW